MLGLHNELVSVCANKFDPIISIAYNRVIIICLVDI